MKRDALSMIELAYDLAPTTGEWLDRLASATYEQLGAGLGMHAVVFDLTSERRIRVREMWSVGSPDGTVDQTASSLEQTPADVVRRGFARGEAITQSQADPSSRPYFWRMTKTLRGSLGWRDWIIISALEPNNHGVYFCVGLPEPTRLPARVALAWTRVAVHLAAGYRLQRRLGGAKVAVEGAGVASGHAEDEALIARTRAHLEAAVREIERARRGVRRSGAKRAIETRTGLASSRWTLVEQFERDGKRYLIARRNETPRKGLEALSARERQALSSMALGHTNKVVAYDMGLSHSTVRVLLHRIAKKLGVTTREEVVAIYAAQPGRGDLRRS